MRYFVSGGAPLSQEIGEFFYAMGMLILEGYGLTETAPLLTLNRPGDFKFGTVGRPVAGDPDPDRSRHRRDPGRGPQVMQGYLNQPEETARVIDADGWFHTGDIGELDPEGRVIITDRLKNIIVLANGKNVAPAPMEIAILTSRYIAQARDPRRQPAVHRGAGGARTSTRWRRGPQPAAWRRCRPSSWSRRRRSQKLIEGEVRGKLEGFAIYERPRRVALLPRLLSEEEGELTPSLKVKNRVVVARWADQVARLFGEKADD